MEIERIDHLVLTVRSIDQSLQFYTEVLGMKAIAFQGKRKAIAFGNQKINLHEKGKEFEPKAAHPTNGSTDICLITSTNIESVESELKDKGIEIIEGIVYRTGAIGRIKSIYIRDPDNNLIELSNYES